MLLIFRRKLAPWAIIAILLLVFSVAHLTYNRDFAIGSVRSLIKGEAASSQDTETPADSATISHRYGLARLMFSLVLRC